VGRPNSLFFLAPELVPNALKIQHILGRRTPVPTPLSRTGLSTPPAACWQAEHSEMDFSAVRKNLKDQSFPKSRAMNSTIGSGAA
jgi:hypothetical protein